jgi:hypothetical protein
VPVSVKVIYGSGIDSGALVDWRGGASWTRVLIDAVKPLGLRLVLHNKAVEIQK